MFYPLLILDSSSILMKKKICHEHSNTELLTMSCVFGALVIHPFPRFEWLLNFRKQTISLYPFFSKILVLSANTVFEN